MGNLERLHAIFAKHPFSPVTGVTPVTTAFPPVTEGGPVTGQNPMVTGVTPVTGQKQGYPQSCEWADISEAPLGIGGVYVDAFAKLQVGCPDGVDDKRWREAVHDAGLFLGAW